MGKEQTGRLSEQSTHAKKGKQVPVKSVSSTLLELKEKLRDLSEEPYAVVPHVGICEGASRQRLVLP